MWIYKSSTVALTRTLRNHPFLTVALLFLILFPSYLELTFDVSENHLAVLDWGSEIVASVLIFLAVPETWGYLNGEERQGSEEWACILMMYVTYCVYAVAVVVGLICFVIPGLLVAVWGCFAVVIAGVEKRSVLTSLLKSWSYVRGNSWRIVGYMVLPMVILISLLTFGYVGYAVLDVTQPDSVVWIGFQTAMSVGVYCWSMFIVAVLVNLYKQCRVEQSAER